MNSFCSKDFLPHLKSYQGLDSTITYHLTEDLLTKFEQKITGSVHYWSYFQSSHFRINFYLAVFDILAGIKQKSSNNFIYLTLHVLVLKNYVKLSWKIPVESSNKEIRKSSMNILFWYLYCWLQTGLCMMEHFSSIS